MRGHFASPGVEPAKHALVLAGVPNGAVRRRRHVMRVIARSQLVILNGIIAIGRRLSGENKRQAEDGKRQANLLHPATLAALYE